MPKQEDNIVSTPTKNPEINPSPKNVIREVVDIRAEIRQVYERIMVPGKKGY